MLAHGEIDLIVRLVSTQELIVDHNLPIGPQ